MKGISVICCWLPYYQEKNKTHAPGPGLNVGAPDYPNNHDLEFSYCDDNWWNHWADFITVWEFHNQTMKKSWKGHLWKDNPGAKGHPAGAPLARVPAGSPTLSP